MSIITPAKKNADSEPMMEMNMTPLIDVMLVLIIMLIITIPKQNHAVNLNMPSIAKQSTPPQTVTIGVDFDGTITWDGALVPDRADLERKLKAVASSSSPTAVMLRPNKLAAYKTVAGVMAAAQRAKVLNLAVTGNEQFI